MVDPLKFERRNTGDRREKPRGGRRPYDVAGFVPLVLVVGDSQEREAEFGTILSRLRFAVTPATNVAEALRVIDAVHPDVIVAGPGPADQLRRDASMSIPIVEFDAVREDGDALVDRIRSVMRTRRQTAG
jgi:CheY-like chemotaxis protein